MMSKGNRQRRPNRRAFTLAAVLLCLLVVMAFSAAVMRGLTLQGRMERWEEAAIQRQHVEEAAASRAVAQLRADRQWTGEQWKLQIPQAGGPIPAEAEIAVASVDDQPNRRRVTIQLRFAEAEQGRPFRPLELTVQLPEPGEPE